MSGTEGSGAPTAELAVGLILALSRNIVAEDRSLRAGTWQTRRIGHVVKGRTLGLVGLGKLETEVAGMGRAFGMDVIAWSPNLTAARAEAGGARLICSPVRITSVCTWFSASGRAVSSMPPRSLRCGRRLAWSTRRAPAWWIRRPWWRR